MSHPTEDDEQRVCFKVNGSDHFVSNNTVPPGTTLNVYLREYLNLRGTKFMCNEGGCGVCVVAAKITNETVAVNSCLVSVLCCDGWEITTIEGIGDKTRGYNPIQTTLAHFSGTQCGYCSPGMVMNMYCLSENGDQVDLTMKEIENSFGGNLCRCTGYRPILDAFKSLAVDADLELTRKTMDIEESHKIKHCPRTGQICARTCVRKDDDSVIHVSMDDADFYKVRTMSQIFDILKKRKKNSTYILNGGNTAHGVYRLTTKPDIYIDLSSVPQLKSVTLGQYLDLGANLSITETMKQLTSYGSTKGFEYLKQMVKHMDLIATVPVRNIGTLAGNLMVKHQHKEFSSDIFLLLETAGATLQIEDEDTSMDYLSLLEFLETDMDGKLIVTIYLKKLKDYDYQTYKIMPRAQNAHAIVNAGFLFKFDSGKVLERPNIIFGGISPDFYHASKTELYLKGKNIYDRGVLSKALEVLGNELKPDNTLPDMCPKFRKLLALGLFYKFVLGICGDKVDNKFKSGATILQRQLSSGRQDYEKRVQNYPLGEPIPKLEAVVQCAGRAKYVNDEPNIPGEVFCAFVVTSVPNGTISTIDTTAALSMKGVVAFYSVKDVPGSNNWVYPHMFLEESEPLFVDKEIVNNGQPIGIIVAESQKLAIEAVKLVEVKYNVSNKPPLLHIEDIINSEDLKKDRVLEVVSYEGTEKGNDIQKVVKGTFKIRGAYHFPMEPHTCLCIPLEDGLDVYSSTQWIDLTQSSIAKVLDIPNNSVNVKVKRLGGGFGSKLTRASHVAAACALAAFKLNRPARFVVGLEQMMGTYGKRCSTLGNYEVGVNNEGQIQYLKTDFYHSNGSVVTEHYSPLTLIGFENCYDYKRWTIKGYEVRTDLPTNIYMRGPGSAEGTAMIENIMNHIAFATNKDSTEVRMNNLDPSSAARFTAMMKKFLEDTRYTDRQNAVNRFNSYNRWKKRAIAVSNMRFPLEYAGCFSVLVSIYAEDGTVAIAHGGIEMGQGVNTKVAQVAAYVLGIPLDMISIKPSNNLTAPNNILTGGSMASDTCPFAVKMACQKLKKRLDAVKKDNQTWKELIAEAAKQNIDLCATHMFPSDNELKSYGIYGMAIAEVEIDVMTGQHLILRADVLEDAGTSLSPIVDVGQVEGAFVQGIGLWTCENLVWDPKTGGITTNRTWVGYINYKIPGAKDIPVDFRVTLEQNSGNPDGIFGSKATGEPPICLSVVVLFALRRAVASARRDAGAKTDEWFDFNGPATNEKIAMACLTDTKQFQLST